MALYPKAKWLPVVGLQNDPVIIPIGVILHVDGGNAGSLYNYFNGPSGGIESTLFVNKKRVWEQFRDTTREADAQAAGNSWVAGDGKRYGFNSIETQGIASEPWTPEQMEELAEFLAWHHKTHGTPLRVCRNPKDSGVGYHRLFPGWNPDNHECPGDKRVAQVPELLKMAQAIVDGIGAIKMGTFVEPEGKLPADGVYYVDEQGVWPVNKARWDFLMAQGGVTLKTISRTTYNALINFANPQSVPTVEEIAAGVVAKLPPVAGGSAPSIEQITAAFVSVVGSTKLTVS